MDTNLKKKDLKSVLLETICREIEVEKVNESDRLRDDLNIDSISSVDISMKFEQKLELENDEKISHFLAKNPNVTVGELLDFVCKEFDNTSM